MKNSVVKNSAKAQSIENEVNSIFDILSSKFSKTSMTVKKVRPGKLQVCKGIIEVTRKGERKPSEKYVFYSGTMRPDKVGSVAIYTDDVDRMLLDLKLSRNFFGRKIISVRKEWGCRPFIDVLLTA